MHSVKIILSKVLNVVMQFIYIYINQYEMDMFRDNNNKEIRKLDMLQKRVCLGLEIIGAFSNERECYNVRREWKWSEPAFL